MNCETLQRAIDERRPGDTAVLPDDFAAHLEGCPACQAYAAGVAAIGRALAHCCDLAASLPEAELPAARERIAGAVAARRAAAAARRRPAFSVPGDPLLVWGTGLAVLLLAAFIGVLAWPRYYAHALKYLQLAIKHDNKQGWGDDARKLLARINAQMMGDPKQI